MSSVLRDVPIKMEMAGSPQSVRVPAGSKIVGLSSNKWNPCIKVEESTTAHAGPSVYRVVVLNHGMMIPEGFKYLGEIEAYSVYISEENK